MTGTPLAMVFMFTVLPMAVAVSGAVLSWLASRFLDERTARVAGFVGTLGYFFGRAGGRSDSNSALEFVAIALGGALLWWTLFKRDTVNV